jgi:GxxExxY protein
MARSINELSDLIRQTGFSLHTYLRSGHLEKVYQTGLANRLLKLGLDVKANYPLHVFDEDGTLLGDYFADLFIEGLLIVEIKACKTLASEHMAQLLGYLRASRVEHGLLINFGPQKFEIRKFILPLAQDQSEMQEL